MSAPKKNITIPSLTQIENAVTKLAAVAAAVEGSTDLGGIPAWLRITLLSAASAIITVNHWLNGQKVTVTEPPAESTPA